LGNFTGFAANRLDLPDTEQDGGYQHASAKQEVDKEFLVRLMLSKNAWLGSAD
jgi:hypothetical protein